jgi:hypothetical protein
LWHRGDWRALLTAIGFAVLLNGAVACTFAWPDWLPVWVTTLGWTVIGVIWTASTWHACRSLSKMHNREDVTGDSLFVQAQQEYLSRDWFEAESLLQQILKLNEDDVDARLMLATLYRRTGRTEDAEGCLSRLERMEGAGKWALEIARERDVLDARELPSNTD